MPWGIAAGVIGAFALTHFMASLLYDVQPTDSSTFAIVTAALAAAGVVACCLPALEAAFVDPIVTLRHE